MKKKVEEILKNEDGWTFMETLIVIAIILILTATVGFMAHIFTRMRLKIRGAMNMNTPRPLLTALRME